MTMTTTMRLGLFYRNKLEEVTSKITVVECDWKNEEKT